MAPTGCQPSPCRAVRRSAAREWPPTQIGGCGFCSGKGSAADVGIAVELAGEAGGRAGPELLEDRDPFVGHRAAPVEIGAVQRLELLLQPADADAQRDPSAGQDIQRRHHLRRQHRVAIGQHQHGGDEAQPLRRAGHHAQDGEGLQRVAAAGMLAVQRCKDRRTCFPPGRRRGPRSSRSAAPGARLRGPTRGCRRAWRWGRGWGGRSRSASGGLRVLARKAERPGKCRVFCATAIPAYKLANHRMRCHYSRLPLARRGRRGIPARAGGSMASVSI